MPSREGRPDRGPDPDGGHDLNTLFETLLSSTKAIEQAVERQAADVAQQLHLQQTMAVGGHGEEAGAAGLTMQYRPQMRAEVIRQLTAHGALPSDPTMGITKVTATGALTSLQNLQAWGAQQLGERIARVNAPPGWKGLYPAEEEKAAGHAAPAAAAESAPPSPEPQPTPRAQPQPLPQPPPARPTLGGTLAPFAQQITQGIAGAYQAVRGYAGGMVAAPTEKTGTLAENRIAASTEETAKATERLEAAVEKEKPPPGVAAPLITPAPAEAPPAGEQKPPPAAGAPATARVAERLAAAFQGEKPAPGAGAPLLTPAPPPPAQQPPAQQPPGQQPPAQQPPGPLPPPPPGPPGQPPPGQPPVGPQPPGQQPPGPPRPSGQQPPPQQAPGQQPQLGGWQNVGARVAMSGGSPGGVLGLLKHIPGVGLAIDVANMGAEQYQKQREAGRVYQEVEGGTNLGAQTERLHSFAYQASMFGRVPQGVAAQMFGDVTGMGFTQRAVGQGQQLQNRQSALNFMYHQYTATGTDPEQAAKILSTASQNATISLKSVSDVMTSLSDSAGKAGTNAKDARDNFNNLLNTVIQTGGASGAPQLAGALATTQATYGNAFKGTSFAGQASTGMQYLMAGQYGITPAQTQYLQRTQPGEYARMLSGSAAQFIARLPGMTPAMMSDLQSMVAAAGGAGAIKTQPALAQSVATQFLNKYQPTTPGMDLNVWAQYLSQVTQVPLTEGTVMQYIVENVSGNTVGSNAAAGAAGGAAGGGGGGKGAPVAAGKTGGAATGKFGLAAPVGATGVAGQALHDVGTIGATVGGLFGLHLPVPSSHGSETWQQVLTGGQQGTAAKEYLGTEKKSGKRSPVLEALLQNTPKDAQVAVKTSAGTRVMSFADAMKYYPNEMEAGQVQFYGSKGQNLGTTGTITQGLIDPSANVKGEESAKGAAARAGVSLSQYQKKHPAAKGEGASTSAGGVTVDLTSEAKQLLKLLPGNSDNAAAAATTPQNPYNTSPSR